MNGTATPCLFNAGGCGFESRRSRECFAIEWQNQENRAARKTRHVDRVHKPRVVVVSLLVPIVVRPHVRVGYAANLFELFDPYLSGVTRRNGAPWSGVRGWPFNS